MPTEHAQMHAGRLKGEKSENPKGKGEIEKGGHFRLHISVCILVPFQT